MSLPPFRFQVQSIRFQSAAVYRRRLSSIPTEFMLLRRLLVSIVAAKYRTGDAQRRLSLRPSSSPFTHYPSNIGPYTRTDSSFDRLSSSIQVLTKCERTMIMNSRNHPIRTMLLRSSLLPPDLTHPCQPDHDILSRRQSFDGEPMPSQILIRGHPMDEVMTSAT